MVALVLGGVDFLFTVVLDFFVAAVALVLVGVVFLFTVLVVLVGFVVVTVVFEEFFVLWAPEELRSIFFSFWLELVFCVFEDFFESPSKDSPSSWTFVETGASDLNALLRPLFLTGDEEPFFLAWSAFARFGL